MIIIYACAAIWNGRSVRCARPNAEHRTASTKTATEWLGMLFIFLYYHFLASGASCWLPSRCRRSWQRFAIFLTFLSFCTSLAARSLTLFFSVALHFNTELAGLCSFGGWWSNGFHNFHISHLSRHSECHARNKGTSCFEPKDEWKMYFF